MDFKELDKQAKALFRKYREYVFLNYTLNEGSGDYKLYSEVNYALNNIDEDCRFLLTKEYIEVSPRYWWRLYYSKSTYYRLKRKAITDLFDCLKSKG